jgi:lysophospholipase L1-like esterase
MRHVMWLVLAMAGVHSAAAQQMTAAPTLVQLRVQPQAGFNDLVCEPRAPSKRPAAAQNPDPMEMPDPDMLPVPVKRPTQTDTTDGPSVRRGTLPPSFRPNFPGQPYRMAIWGDSHLAAGFFSEELVKQLNVPGDAVSNVLLPANMGRAGIRLPIRRSCVSPQWKYEPGYLGRDNTTAPGPGLMNMFSDQPDSTLAWDVRKDAKAPGYERVRILYQQTGTLVHLAISVDGGAEQPVILAGQEGPAVLELLAEQPISQIRLRLVSGALRFQGLELSSPQAHPFEIDVFGYPGATVAGWKSADIDYLRRWFVQRPYQLVMLEFGTNEGNAAPFNLAAYRNTLTESVRNMRAVFPSATCILIAPGDRGVLVPHSVNTRRRKAGRLPDIDLMRFATIHADIGRTQREVAEEAGCIAWSMQDAMGGPGQSYHWAQQTPAWMAKDLIHFTAAGYRQLAREFVMDMGWVPLPTPAAQKTLLRVDAPIL